MGAPHVIPAEGLARIGNIANAERMKNKEGNLTRAVLCTLSGPVPEQVGLVPFGEYTTGKYVPEPMHCYKCQRYGNHKAHRVTDVHSAVDDMKQLSA